MSSLMQALNRFWRDESGATAIEYALIASGLASALIVAINHAGAGMSRVLSTPPARIN